MSNVESLSTNEINQRLKHIYDRTAEYERYKNVKEKEQKHQGIRVIMKQK